jgi:predicted TIM-barrel fold metal-dependent hydrolase
MDEIIDVNTMFGPLPAAASDLSVDELDGMMRKHGVRACCTLSTVGMLLDHNSGNGATRAACAEHQNLIPVATVNPQSVFGVDGPFTRFKADGFKLIRLFPDEQCWEADYAPCVVLAKRLEVEGLPIMVNVGRPGEATKLVAALVTHPAPLILAGVDEKTASEAVALMRAHARIYVETSNLLAVGAIKQVVECVGADRVLYGSGAPSRPMASSLAVLRYADLTDAQRTQILGGNAKALLGV